MSPDQKAEAVLDALVEAKKDYRGNNWSRDWRVVVKPAILKLILSWRNEINGTASLYALQQELKQVEGEMTDILRPGGVAYKVTPKGRQLKRFEELTELREGLKARIASFAK